MPAAAVGVVRRRKTNTTIITKAIVTESVSSMSSTLARMVEVRSLRTETSMPPGRNCWSCGISALTRSTVAMTLALACLRTWISTAG